jgi:hypothetical protein
MFRLFRKTNSTRQQNAVKSKLAGILEVPVRKAKIRFATTLGRYEKRLSNSGKKRALLIFCISMGSLFAFQLYEGVFSHRQTKPAFLQQQTITRPQNPTLPDSLDLQRLRQHKHLQDIKDSLSNSIKR